MDRERRRKMNDKALSQEPTFDDECQKDMDEAWEQIQKKRKRIPVTLDLTPCDNAISRNAVRKILAKYHLGESRIAEELNELPFVQRTSNADEKHVENTLDDAVSRDAVIKCLERGDTLSSIDHRLIDKIKRLPSVTVRQTGEWIALENRFELGDRVKCSECGQVFVVGDDVSRNFCSNCGAKMVEPQESEDKE